MSNPTVSEALAQELQSVGVDRVFGLPGGEVLGLIDALRRSDIEFALCRHEANAGIMAAVYGKLKRTVGVVLTTLGPGASNLMLPIASSLLDREPLLAIAAQVPTSWPAERTHQRLPLLESFRPLTKHSGSLHALNCRSLLRTAVAAATSEPQGPAFLTLSSDDAHSVAQEADPGVRPALLNPVTLRPAGEVADELTRIIGEAQHPLIVVGLGTRPEVSEPLRRWIDDWRLPVVVTPKVKGIIDERSPHFIGVVSGMAIDALMVEAIRESDCVVGFGLDPVEIDGSWHMEVPMTWVLESPWATGLAPRTGLLAVDHDQLLAAMAKTPPRHWDSVFEHARARRQIFLEDTPTLDPHPTPTSLVRTLMSAVPPETIVVTDVGSHKCLFGQFWESRFPETFFMSNGLSGMGYGLSAAIGASLARPEAPVLTILGDGGFSMNSQELETAKRLGAHFVTVVVADQSYSLIRHSQRSRGLDRYGVDFAPIDSVATAAACGIRAIRVEGLDMLARPVGEAIRSGESLLVEVPLDPDSYRGIL